MASPAFSIPDTVASRLSSLRPEPDHPGLGWLIGPAEVEAASSESYPILSSILSSNTVGKQPTVDSISSDLKEALILIPAGLKVCGAFLFEGSGFKKAVITALGGHGGSPTNDSFVIATISSSGEKASSRDQAKETNDLRWTAVKAGASGGFEEQEASIDLVTGEVGSPAWQHPLLEDFWKERSVIHCDLPVKLPLYLSPYQCEWPEYTAGTQAAVRVLHVLLCIQCTPLSTVLREVTVSSFISYTHALVCRVM